ncbi:hypothetical protein ED733_001957 [Metarhizium rileyi]|uniref:Uncharacterized protein n=1 Tax=Metarhizium rileyi (strain RCEF 4871) TaxID=1649241 RepID=A0A5C6G657_METRR|nr:hypothetical protein ED733_001957 [Metarhizium rileyi]
MPEKTKNKASPAAQESSSQQHDEKSGRRTDAEASLAAEGRSLQRINRQRHGLGFAIYADFISTRVQQCVSETGGPQQQQQVVEFDEKKKKKEAS